MFDNDSNNKTINPQDYVNIEYIDKGNIKKLYPGFVYQKDVDIEEAALHCSMLVAFTDYIICPIIKDLEKAGSKYKLNLSLSAYDLQKFLEFLEKEEQKIKVDNERTNIEKLKVNLFIELIHHLYKIHQKGILLLDLKPQNIVISYFTHKNLISNNLRNSYTVQLIDFESVRAKKKYIEEAKKSNAKLLYEITYGYTQRYAYDNEEGYYYKDGKIIVDEKFDIYKLLLIGLEIIGYRNDLNNNLLKIVEKAHKAPEELSEIEKTIVRIFNNMNDSILKEILTEYNIITDINIIDRDHFWESISPIIMRRDDELIERIKCYMQFFGIGDFDEIFDNYKRKDFIIISRYFLFDYFGECFSGEKFIRRRKELNDLSDMIQMNFRLIIDLIRVYKLLEFHKCIYHGKLDTYNKLLLDRITMQRPTYLYSAVSILFTYPRLAKLLFDVNPWNFILNCAYNNYEIISTNEILKNDDYFKNDNKNYYYFVSIIGAIIFSTINIEREKIEEIFSLCDNENIKNIALEIHSKINSELSIDERISILDKCFTELQGKGIPNDYLSYFLSSNYKEEVKIL